MSNLSWRAATAGDAAHLAALFGAIARTAPVGLETDLAEIQARLSRPGLDLDTDTLIGFDLAGELRAYAEAADMGVGHGQLRIRLTSALHPDLSSGAIREALDWLLGRARQIHRERRPDLPGVLGARCAAAGLAQLALLTDAGFQIARRQQDLVRATEPPLPPASTPEGIVVVPYYPRYDEAARVAHNDAYAEDPSALLPDLQTWPEHAVGLPNFLPDASFLALATTAEGTTAEGGDIAAFLFSLEYRDSTGRREGLLHCLGTRRPWRRQGLAAAMINRALTVYQQAGLTQARLQVSDDNTGAVSLYTQLGFADSGRGYAMLQAPIR
jgi:mycothiol synthase